MSMGNEMTTTATSESQVNQILGRRRQLKRQRRVRFWQATWRTLATIGLTVGLGWTLTQPEWQIRQPSQVKIITVNGKPPRSRETLEQFLELSYPVSLMQLRPQAIANQLETRAHISKAIVRRQLFPPRLIISVQEHDPVALTRCDRCVLVTDPTRPNAVSLGPDPVWLLDHRGVALPLSSYPHLSAGQPLPPLEVVNVLKPLPEPATQSLTLSAEAGPVQGMAIDGLKQRQWQQMYPTLHKSPVKIVKVGWQPSNTLILTTQLGQVHLGPYGPKLGQQLRVLDQMRSLPNAVDPSQIAYIDLEQPERPVLELRNPSPSKPKPQP